jgi:hypothetical protein
LFTSELDKAGVLRKVYTSNQPVAQNWLHRKRYRQIKMPAATNATIARFVVDTTNVA